MQNPIQQIGMAVGDPPSSRERSFQGARPRLRWPLILLILGGCGFWLWYGGTQRSFAEDDVISVLAVRGIVEHGVPRLPSGYLYYRGLVGNYISALPVWLGGESQTTLIAGSILMLAGVLALTYLIARDVLARPGIGLAAVAILLTLDLEGLYATTPRMYMGLQFFTMLALYGAWRGYVENDLKFALLVPVAIVCSFFQHDQAGALLPAVAAAVLLGRTLLQKQRSGPRLAADLAVLVVLSLLFLRIRQGFPGGFPESGEMGGAGALQGGVPLNPIEWLKPGQWASHAGRLEVAMPMLIPLAPLLSVMSIKAWSNRKSPPNAGFLFLVVFVAICGLATMSVIQYPATRFWMFILPIGALLVAYAVSTLLDVFRPWKANHHLVPDARVTAACLVIGFTPVGAAYTIQHGPMGYVDALVGGFGLPCDGGGVLRRATVEGCHREVGLSHALVAQQAAGGDLVVTSNQLVTAYYAGRADLFLRELPSRTGEAGQFSEFSISTEEYLGATRVDTPEELMALSQAPQRVWIVADKKVQEWLSPRGRAILDQEFETYFSNEYLRVYTSR